MIIHEIYRFMFEKLKLSGMDSISSFFEKAYDDLTVGDIELPKNH